MASSSIPKLGWKSSSQAHGNLSLLLPPATTLRVSGEHQLLQKRGLVRSTAKKVQTATFSPFLSEKRRSVAELPNFCYSPAISRRLIPDQAEKIDFGS
ncbi:hypothetical protein KFK09_024633 [Dendrobium nobile]|uniref:Uncharacterized protein n=1 Tax=Dendrobium nobile TaxID=94219 RepID=A0A8T3AJU1_DENNO|nr:hypothetical protein KFK09_024633 [Dendrobium nobile]